MDGQNFENEQIVTPEVETPVVETPVVEAVPEKKTDALAIVSLVLGILGIVVACCSPLAAVVMAVAGIVCAVLSKKNNGKSGLATAGLVCSIVAIVAAVISFVIAMVGLAFLESAGVDYTAY